MIDPTGNGETVYVVGHEAEETVEKLNESTNIEITRDEASGQLSYTGEAVTEADKVLAEAIDSKEVAVRVDTGKTQVDTDGRAGADSEVVGGAYMGNRAVSDAATGERKVIANQFLDLKECKANEAKGFDPAGNVVAHEVMEAYISGKDVYDSGGQGYSRVQGVKNGNYDKGHYEALKAMPLQHVKLTRDSSGNFVQQASYIPNSGYAPIDTSKLR